LIAGKEEQRVKVSTALPVGIYYSFEPLYFAFLKERKFLEILVLLDHFSTLL